MAKTIDTLAIKIIADAGDVSQGLGKVTKEVREAARIVESLASPLDRIHAKEARLNQLFADGAITNNAHSLSLARLRDRMNEIKTPNQIGFGQVAAQVPVFGTLFAAVTSATGAVALLGMAFREMGQLAHTAVDFVVDAGKRIDEVSDQADRLGLSVGALSELKIAATFADVKDFGSVEKGLEKMQINVAKAAGAIDDLDLETKKAAAAFSILHLKANDLIGLKPDQMFARISKELAEIPTNAQRMEIIKDIFGKSGNELKLLIEHLDEFKSKAMDSQAIITREQADIIERADDAIKGLKASIEGLGNILATDFAPSLTKVVDALSFLSHLNPEMIPKLIAAGMGFKGDSNAIDEAIKSGTFFRTNAAAAFEKEQRDNAPASDAQKEINLAKAEADRLKSERSSPEFLRARKEEETFASMEKSLHEQIVALTEGAQAAEEYKIAMLDMDDGLKFVLQSLHEVKIAEEAKRHAEEMDIKNARERVNEAESIKHGLLDARELAVERLQKAQDLVTTGELTQSAFDRLLSKEARGLEPANVERKAGAAAFNSQEAIAATLGRNQNTDSQNLESMKNSLLALVNKEPDQVEEVASIN